MSELVETASHSNLTESLSIAFCCVKDNIAKCEIVNSHLLQNKVSNHTELKKNIHRLKKTKKTYNVPQVAVSVKKKRYKHLNP